MMMTRIAGVLLPCVAALGLGAHCFGATISIDENGNGIGTLGPGFLARDPGPGGLNNVLTYQLPFAGVAGDVFLNAAEGIFDVVRFNGNGTVIFYSDNVPTFDSIADTFGPPTARYPNFVVVTEVGPEGQNGAVYTPTPNQPGYNASAPTYVLVSDGTVIPEPSSTMLLISGTGLVGVVTIVRRRFV